MLTSTAAMPTSASERVSVIIATHRRPLLARAAIASVQRQSVAPCEVIVADDGHTLPADFGDQDRDDPIPVRYLPLPRTGMCAARRAGYAASHGDLLLFLDDDDELEPGAIACLLQLLSSHPDAAVAAGSADVTDEAGHRTGSQYIAPETIRAEDLWSGNRIINAGTALIRRSAYEQVGGWDLDCPNANDYLLWLKLVHVGRIVGTADVVLRYREHVANESTKGNQFLHLGPFRRAFRRVCPEHAYTPVEDSVLAAIVRNHAEATYWHLRQLIRQKQWREAGTRLGRLASATLIAARGNLTRRELTSTFARLRPRWLRA